MPQQHHDHRRHRQRQQHTGKAEQFAAGKNGENHRHRVQADAVTHQQRRQHRTLKHLAHHEHRNDAQHRVQVATELKQPGNQRRANTNDEAHVRHNGSQPRQHAYQQAKFEPHQHQPGRVDDAQREHHHQLATDERAQHFMAFFRQPHDLRLALAWQQAAQLGHHQVPVTQQVEAHHRDQYQVGQPADQGQARSGRLGQYDADDVGGLAHVLANGGLDLVELPEAIGQAKAVLHPRQRHVLQPVKHLRCQLVQAHQLLGQHRHQHQQQGHEHQGEKAEYHHHAPGTRQPQTFQTVNQRVCQISQQNADQKGGKDVVQAI
ncbi:hypothetical protein D3C81_1060420 [compost metagenome]